MAQVTKRPRYATMNGICYPEMFSPKCFQEAMEYKPEVGDVFVNTYPKCGTTWMQNVVLQIFNKGKEFEDPDEFLAVSPFIDMLGMEGIVNMPRPGAFKTHLPYKYLPNSPDAKYVFVARNPKDCCVSFYHHAKNIAGFEFWDGTFDDFFELFMAGEVEYNDYFDHLLGWYPHRDDLNVFYTTYEDMKEDLKTIVLNLAEFLGDEYIDAIEKDNNVLRNILHFTSFDYMKTRMSEVYAFDKNRDVSKWPSGLQYYQKFVESLNPPDDIPAEFVRKGVVGDWKNHFSHEQSMRLNMKYLVKLKDTEVLRWFPLE